MVMVLGAVIQGASQHVGMYIVARMILGFGIPCCIVAGAALIGELAYAKERPVLTSLFNVSYFIGKSDTSHILLDPSGELRLTSYFSFQQVKSPPPVSAAAQTR